VIFVASAPVLRPENLDLNPTRARGRCPWGRRRISDYFVRHARRITISAASTQARPAAIASGPRWKSSQLNSPSLGQRSTIRGPYCVGNLNGATILEKDTPLETLAPQLTAMGHTVRVVPLESGLHIVERLKHGFVGGADPRRDGVAIGD